MATVRHPTASVVVPTHRRPAALRHCLEALAAQDLPRGDYEVIVVVDGDEGLPAARAVAASAPLEVRLVAQPHTGPAAARNRGAAMARGGWLAFTDDDCRPTPSWLRELGGALTTGSPALVGGGVRNAAPGVFAAASQLVLEVAIRHFERTDDPALFFPSNNIAVWRADYERIGGFDTAFRAAAAEDRDICDRARDAGLELRRAPAAVIDHHHALTLRGLWRQHHNYGRGARSFELARARRGRVRLQVSPSYFAALVAEPFRRSGGTAAIGLVLATAVTQAAYVAGYARERLRPGSR